MREIAGAFRFTLGALTLLTAACSPGFVDAGARCGDGLVNAPETCDDGNTLDGDGCTGECAVEDGFSCTSGGGPCMHRCAGDGECDDGAFCNGGERCDGNGVCVAGTPPTLADGVDCTIDTCDEATDLIVHTPSPAACDDGLFCDGTESCDAILGCQAGVSPVVADAVACTVDACDENLDVVTHSPDNGRCDDSQVCTTDTCDGSIGCTHSYVCPCVTAAECNDSNPCTTDSCSTAGTCVYSNNPASCDDGMYCNGADTCGGGSCSLHAGDPCAAGGACANTCDETRDSCNLPVDTGCTSDNNPCTDDRCDGLGACTHPNNAAACSDGLYCNGPDTCLGGVCGTHAGDPCAGGPACRNLCNEAADNCYTPAQVACPADTNGCTDDACNGVGACTHPNNTAPCDDGLFCNGADTCAGGACAHTGDPCSGGVECRNACDEAGDTCDLPAGASCAGDADTCTSDICDGLGSCTHPNVCTPPHILNFAATPASVPPGIPTTVTFTWSYAGTPSPTPTCSIGPSVGTVTPGATATVTLSAPTTYSLTCVNGGGTDTAALSIRPLRYTGISTGETHACGLRDDGTLWCWGRNFEGELGDGTTAGTGRPVQAGASNGWAAVSAGTNTTCGVRVDGTMWCWGSGYSSTPAQVGTATSWTQVSVGFDHRCGVQNDGSLWCWGQGFWGQLGDGSRNAASVPLRVDAATDWASVSAGYTATCGLRSGALYCWGFNAGDGSFYQATPTRVGGAGDWTATRVGTWLTCGLRSGTMWCWGRNDYGELGDGTIVDKSSPVQVGGAADWVSLGGGYHHSCALRSGGSMWCWGLNEFGELGDGTTGAKPSPVQVGAATAWAAVSASSGSTGYTCALSAGGDVYCWGANRQGELGLGFTTSTRTPTQVGGAVWAQVGPGIAHTCAVRTDGTLWCWGDNYYGTLGDGTNVNRPEPVQVGGATNWKAAAGGYHACAVRTDGTLWCWGFNGHGELGDSSTSPRNAPFQVGGSSWVQVTTGAYHTCARTSTGTVWCWGRNTYGAVGDGSNVSRGAPVQVGGASDWIDVVAGVDDTCGLRAGGSLWCWGYNDWGALGDGTNVNRSSPVQIGSGRTWVQVSPGESHACAVEAGGARWCWGTNSDAQYGNGLDDVAGSMSPDRADADTDWSRVAAGWGTTCGLRVGGTLWCWGYNGDGGAVGDGSYVAVQTRPVQLGTAANWVEISQGAGHTCARRADATLWCWGYNGDGEIGVILPLFATPRPIIY